ncbi:unnamed protein product [Phyllotreta striolata]|uniref:Uncharacterized protein n=1 Tax=Phyllotreta striolata TaxID=444603 RepID=A0A9N9TTR3_PHYSR|nr:unnamed protein product [Phyllotreta striolata]
MLESDVKLMKLKNLNLLLKQQIIQQIEETEENEKCTQLAKSNSDQHNSVSYESQLSVKETTIQYYREDESSKYEDLKVVLANIQIDESTAALQDQVLIESYELIENLLDHCLQYLDCMILEIKSSLRFTQVLNSYVVHENKITGPISNSLKKVCETAELESLEDLKSKLFVSLNRYENIKQLKQEHDQRKNDYKLALKNFKIILEVMNINQKSLNKLRHQFEDVLMNYKHARAVLNQELPFVLTERTKVLSDCLKLLGHECDVWGGNRLDLSRLLMELGNLSIG